MLDDSINHDNHHTRDKSVCWEVITVTLGISLPIEPIFRWPTVRG